MTRAGELMAPDSNARRRVLLVEDEALIALELEATLDAAGFDVVEHAATLAAAIGAAESAVIDAAVLDVSLARQQVWPAAKILLDRGIPILFLTGFASQTFPPPFDTIPKLEKPCPPEVLVARLTALFAP
ncbi:MAG: response regulator [Micropepsaceae bacterium]